MASKLGGLSHSLGNSTLAASVHRANRLKQSSHGGAQPGFGKTQRGLRQNFHRSHRTSKINVFNIPCLEASSFPLPTELGGPYRTLLKRPLSRRHICIDLPGNPGRRTGGSAPYIELLRQARERLHVEDRTEILSPHGALTRIHALRIK